MTTTPSTFLKAITLPESISIFTIFKFKLVTKKMAIELATGLLMVRVWLQTRHRIPFTALILMIRPQIVGWREVLQAGFPP